MVIDSCGAGNPSGINKWGITMLKSIKNFWESDSGAVTADFVMLTSAIVGMGIAVAMVIAPGIKPNAENVSPHANGAAVLGSSIISN